LEPFEHIESKRKRIVPSAEINFLEANFLIARLLLTIAITNHEEWSLEDELGREISTGYRL
jgi:hypothetical protein